MSNNPRFWRNATLIALAHIALIGGLIHWSLSARSMPDTQSLVWLSNVDSLEGEKLDHNAMPPAEVSASRLEPEPLRLDETQKEQPSLTQAKSEIELPAATPRSTPTTPPKPKAMPKATPRRKALATLSKSSTHAESSVPKSKEKKTDSSKGKKKTSNTVTAKKESSTAGKTGSMRNSSGHAGGGNSGSEFGWYGNMLHDRFYGAWDQPTSTVASGLKISTLVKVRIEKDGRVSKFEIVKPSENVVVNESVAAIAKRVTEVDPPPAGLGNGSHYDVKINFELNTNQKTER